MHTFKNIVNGKLNPIATEAFGSIRECEECFGETKVIDTATNIDTGMVKRRRRCLDCDAIFNTYELREEDVKNLLERLRRLQNETSL